MRRPIAGRLGPSAPPLRDTLEAARGHESSHPIAADGLALELQRLGDPRRTEHAITVAM